MKKLLSLVLALAMCLSLESISAFATDVEDAPDAEENLEYEYDLPEDQAIVLGDSAWITGSTVYGWAWDEDGNYYDGEFPIIYMTSESDDVCVPWSDGDWWIDAVGYGSAVITIGFEGPYGEEEATFTVEVISEQYQLDAWLDADGVFNGESADLCTNLMYTYYADENGFTVIDAEGDFRYEWSIEEFSVRIQDEDGNWNPEQQDYQDYVDLQVGEDGTMATLITGLSDIGEDGAEVSICCTVYNQNEDEPLIDAWVWIFIEPADSTMFQTQIDYSTGSENLCPGQSITVTPTFMWITYDAEAGERVYHEYGLQDLGMIEELFGDGGVADYVIYDDAGLMDVSINDNDITITAPEDIDMDEYGGYYHIEIIAKNSDGDGIGFGFDINLCDSYYSMPYRTECEVTSGTVQNAEAQLDLSLMVYDSDHPDGEEINPDDYGDFHYDVWIADARTDNDIIDVDSMSYLFDQDTQTVNITFYSDPDTYPVYVLLHVDAWDGDDWLAESEVMITVNGEVEAETPHVHSYVLSWSTENLGNSDTWDKMTLTCSCGDTLTCTYCPTEGYTDVSSTDWYHGYVDYVVNNGIMTGTGTGTFSPYLTMTRGSMAQLLYNLSGKPSVEGLSNAFLDVSEDDWYYDAVVWAGSCGVSNGDGNGNFLPDGILTREQVAQFLYNYAQVMGCDTSATAELNFSDAGDVDDWALEAVQWAVGAGLISGNDVGAVMPITTCSRVETATMITRYCLSVLGW